MKGNYCPKGVAHYHHRELGLKAELATCQNDAQLAKAEAWLVRAKVQHAKAKIWHADTATTLQQAHIKSIAALDWETTAEEELSTVLEAYPSEDHWALIYPLQLLASGISLTPIPEMPAAAWPQAMADTGSVPAPLTPDTPEPKSGVKWWWLSSSQGMPNLGQEEEALCDSTKEPPTRSRNL